ncbi:MAG: thiamine-phosphate kinase [Candidatus Bathyarchaeia archaeon]
MPHSAGACCGRVVINIRLGIIFCDRPIWGGWLIKSNLTERGAIEVFHRFLSVSPDSPVPFGDDVAAVEVDRGLLAILKADMFVERTDAPKGMTHRQMARKAVVATVSDFAAKGVNPLALISSVGLPSSCSMEVVEELAKGLRDASEEYGAPVIGGDTNESEGLVIDIAGFGFARKGSVLLRSGARPGDVLASTGRFGGPSAGLMALQAGFKTGPGEAGFIEAVYKPRAHLREGLALARSGAATASIDSSDGLAWSLHELARASNVGFLVTEIPLSQGLTDFAERAGADPYDLALYGGEEYNLVVTVNEEKWGDACRAVEREGSQLFKLGRVTEDPSLILEREGGRTVIQALGWQHFASLEGRP